MNDVFKGCLEYIQREIDKCEKQVRWLEGDDPKVLEEGAVSNKKKEIEEWRNKARILCGLRDHHLKVGEILSPIKHNSKT